LSLIILGEESMTGDNMDTYLQFLLEEFQLLWHEGVWMRDVANYNGTSHFTLKVILMWCIHDFLAFKIMASCVTKGCHACPICGPQTSSHQSNVLSKHVYCNQHRQWLPLDHGFQDNLAAFDGICEMQSTPPKVKVDDIIRWGNMKKHFLQQGRHP